MLSILEILRLFNKINGMIKLGEQIIIAIEGNSGAGKTSLASRIGSVYDCNIFTMDSFFLQTDQRTAERLGQTGGNVDYLRFEEQLLRPLRAGRAFKYRPYDCARQALAEEIDVTPKGINIIEGVYSLHPNFSEIYGLRVFLKVSIDEQLRRLRRRDIDKYSRYVEEWIPMENKYFDSFDIEAQCDIVIDTTLEPPFIY